MGEINEQTCSLEAIKEFNDQLLNCIQIDDLFDNKNVVSHREIGMSQTYQLWMVIEITLVDNTLIHIYDERYR